MVKWQALLTPAPRRAVHAEEAPSVLCCNQPWPRGFPAISCQKFWSYTTQDGQLGMTGSSEHVGCQVNHFLRLAGYQDSSIELRQVQKSGIGVLRAPCCISAIWSSIVNCLPGLLIPLAWGSSLKLFYSFIYSVFIKNLCLLRRRDPIIFFVPF